MAEPLKFVYGTEAQILALTPESPNWINRAFYYPGDRDYFYQALDGVMKMYGGGFGAGVGAKINDKVIGSIKVLIEASELLDIPENWDYNTFSLDIDGTINCAGQINTL